MATSDPAINSVIEILEQCDFFDRESGASRLLSADSSLVAFDFGSNAMLT